MNAQLIAKHFDGLPLDNGDDVQISFDKEFIIIEHIKYGFPWKKVLDTYKIKISNVIDTLVAKKEEIETVNRSVIGRGIVGGVIFGPIGAVLGGMSAVNHQKVGKNTYFIISYNSSDGEIKNASFDAGMNFMTIDVAKKLSSQINKKKPKTLAPEPKVHEL